MRARSLAWCAFLLVGACPASSTTYLVNADGSGDFATIQAGLAGAAPGDTLLLGDGAYTGPGNFGLDPHGKDLVVRSASGDPLLCVIDGQDAEVGFVLHSGETAAFILDGIGFARGENLGGNGGGLQCDATSPTVKRCRFSHCRAGANGGAVGVLTPGSGPVFVDCVFVSNTCTTWGGAVGMHAGGSASFSQCSFESNSAPEGGAISAYGGASIDIVDCTFLGNSATRGGGVSCWQPSSTCSIASSQFIENVAYDFGAGVAIWVWAAGTMQACTVRDNVSFGSGGGLMVQGTCTATSCLFSGNVAVSSGGGIKADQSDLTLSSSVITGNYADTYGGGVFLATSSLTLGSSTIAGNHGRLYGGGIHAQQNAVAHCVESIVYGNCAIIGADVAAVAANLVEFECCAVDTTRHRSLASDALRYGVDNVFGDPLFCDPMACSAAPSTGGLYTLRTDSPCLPANSPCGLLIGALGLGCGPIGIEPLTWGEIKSRFR